jgi:hypothetical protein
VTLTREGPSANRDVNLLLSACEGCGSEAVRRRLRAAIAALDGGQPGAGKALLGSVAELERVVEYDWRLAVLIWLHLQVGAIDRAALGKALDALASDAKCIATFR